MIKKVKLIIFDGIDGSGKSTQAKLITKKIKAVYLKEPCFFKKQILKEINPLTEVFLFLADRSEVYAQVEKFLKKGRVVILDRSYPSTLAYQVLGKGLEKVISLEEYLKIDLIARKHIQPDLVIIFDLPVKIALSRLKNKTKFEKRKFLEKVRKNYLYLAKKFDWIVIDAKKDVKTVNEEILKLLKSNDLLK